MDVWNTSQTRMLEGVAVEMGVVEQCCKLRFPGRLTQTRQGRQNVSRCGCTPREHVESKEQA